MSIFALGRTQSNGNRNRGRKTTRAICRTPVLRRPLLSGDWRGDRLNGLAGAKSRVEGVR